MILGFVVLQQFYLVFISNGIISQPLNYAAFCLCLCENENSMGDSPSLLHVDMHTPAVAVGLLFYLFFSMHTCKVVRAGLNFMMATGCCSECPLCVGCPFIHFGCIQHSHSDTHMCLWGNFASLTHIASSYSMLVHACTLYINVYWVFASCHCSM